MAWFSRWLKQTATYWAPLSEGGVTADPTFVAPVAIACRWIEKDDKFISPEGRDEVSSSTVWTEVAVELKGYLLLGTSTVTDPVDVDGAFLIRRIRRVPNTDGSKTARKALL